MVLNKKQAFTLVELIVVIVILSILATIAFLSFSSQSSSARDSTRLSDISNITKGLGVFNAISSKLPIPDNSISITASGTTIGYQGYAGSSVLNMIKMSNGGKDPADKTYYTYSTNLLQNKYQILGFLEDGNNISLNLNPDLLNKPGLEGVFAEPISYTGRYLITKGDKVGVILSSGSLLPIQTPDIIIGNSIDIANTSQDFTVQFSNDSTINGTGGILITSFSAFSKNISNYDPSLVGYWDMETLSGTKLKDLSSSQNDGTCYHSGVTVACGLLGSGPQLSDGNGKTGKSMSFAREFGQRVVANLNVSRYSSGSAPRTLLVFMKMKDILSQYGGGLKYGSDYALSTYHTNKLFFYGWGAKDIPGKTVLKLDEWYFVAVSYDGVENKLYLNGILDAVPNSTSLNTTVSSVLIGSIHDFWNGSIDEVRVYNRALSESEIKTIYSATK